MKGYWWTTSQTGCDETVTPNVTPPDFEPRMLIRKRCHCRGLLREDQDVVLMYFTLVENKPKDKKGYAFG